MGDARTVIKRTAAGVFLAGAEMMNMNKASTPPTPSAFGQALDDILDPMPNKRLV